jgi:hypothetical protein
MIERSYKVGLQILTIQTDQKVEAEGGRQKEI